MLAAITSGIASLATGPVSIAPISQPQLLYDFSESACGANFIPDAPSRLFARSDGQMVLVASYIDNWMMTGASFGQLKADCHSTLPMTAYRDKVRGKLWIEGTHTADGRTIHAVASESLRTYAVSRGCDVKLPGRCWVNQLTSLVSKDGGRSFSVLGPLASFGEEYPTGQKSRFGIFTTSNIVKRGNAWYFLAYASAGVKQPRGNCLFRSTDITDPKKWRVWDGSTFSIDPMRFERPCASTFPSSPVRSISYLSGKKLWASLVSDTLKLPGEARATPGFFFMTSPDLLAWTKPVRIMSALLRPRIDSRDEIWYYPSLFDPLSKSRNFETIDHAEAVITFTSRRLRNGVGTLDRDLKFVRVKID